MPSINYRLRILKNGNITIGTHVKFNSSSNSNFAGIYKTCSIAVVNKGNLLIGDHTGFSGCSVFCSNSIKIGKYCNFGVNTSIWDTDFHPIDDYQARRRNDNTQIKTEPIEIGNDVFVGANSIILKGVTIGDRAVIGANSLVCTNIPSDEVWGGNPAKFIRKIERTGA